MQYSEIKSLFTSILNRRDITPSQITNFLTLGTQYVQRKLRVPPMEKLLDYTTDGTSLIPVPGDFLEAIAVYIDDSVNQDKLERHDLQTVMRASQKPGSPVYFCRVGSNFMVGPTPPSGTIVYINYYADMSALSADTDHNWLTDAAPTVLVYAALKYAADHFLDDRKAAFAETLAEDLADVQEMANRDELVGASISPVYPDQIQSVY